MIKVFLKLQKKMKINRLDFITNLELKEIFRDIYTELGITDIPKGTDIKEYYVVEDVTKRVNGITTKGFIIKHPLYKTL